LVAASVALGVFAAPLFYPFASTQQADERGA